MRREFTVALVLIAEKNTKLHFMALFICIAEAVYTEKLWARALPVP